MITETLHGLLKDVEEEALEKEEDGEDVTDIDESVLDALCAPRELLEEAQGQTARVPYPVLPSLHVHGLERKASLKGKQQRKTRQARMGRPTKPMNNWFWKFSSARGSGK